MTTTLKKNRRRASGDSLIEQSSLPYDEGALAPYISSRTLNFHYGKHHKTYVDKTNHLVQGTEFEGFSLKEILLETAGRSDLKKLFNNAAQAWNHDFYWQSMKPRGGGKPGHELLSLFKSSFGGWDDFYEKFFQTASEHFGSGWIWLVKERDRLKVIGTHDADNPLTQGLKPLLALDVWEHAYYLDYQNRRPDYVKIFLDRLVNWEFAENQL